jgi:hypothetical protein
LFEHRGILDVLSSDVKAFRQFAPVRALLAGLLMLGWILAGNHCAFGLMTPTAEQKTEVCPCQPAPTTPAPSELQECCHPVPSLPADMAKVQVSFDASVVAVLDFAVVEVLAETEAMAPRFEGGPPGAQSFSELVLQRSLRSLAPPTQA